MVTNDHNGLNTGAFYLRVSEWAVHYLIDIIALRTFKPEVKLKYSDQSAMEIMTLDVSGPPFVCIAQADNASGEIFEQHRVCPTKMVQCV